MSSFEGPPFERENMLECTIAFREGGGGGMLGVDGIKKKGASNNDKLLICYDVFT